MAKTITPWPKRSLFRGLSIQQRLPLFICILLLGTMIAFGWISYLGVKRAELKSGHDRLNSLSEQLSSLLGQSAAVLVSSTRAATQQPVLRNYLAAPSSTDPQPALDIIKKLQTDSTHVLVDLLDTAFHPVLRSGRHHIESRVDFIRLLTANGLPDTGRVGNIMIANDSMYYPVVAGIVNNNRLTGYLVRWRLIVSTSRTLAQLSQLMGDHAKLYIGNSDSSVWTDMIRPVKNPLAAAEKKQGVYAYTNEAGEKSLGVPRSIANTPWVVMIGFSRQDVLQNARDFLKWEIIIGIIIVCAGSFVAWLMSRAITRPLNKLTAAASSLASGRDTPVVIEVDRFDETGKLGRAFAAMTAQVTKAKLELEKKVTETEEMNLQLRNLSAHLQNIREEERMHIAREMHDELGQFLTGLKMDISWLNKKLNADDQNAANKEKLTEMAKLVDEAVIFVRKLAAELRPSILDDLGLIPALEWHSREFTRRFNIAVDFRSSVQELSVSEDVATGLFRMYQESLTNVARHAQASQVSSRVAIENGDIQLSVTDNGKGFDTAGPRKTLGLLGMKERAVMIGGKLDIISQPGNGTTVLITVPLQKTVTSQKV